MTLAAHRPAAAIIGSAVPALTRPRGEIRPWRSGAFTAKEGQALFLVWKS